MRLFLVTMFMAGVCVVAMPSPTNAADEKETFVFAYRLLEPQTKEFEDSKKGEAFVKALGKLGGLKKLVNMRRFLILRTRLIHSFVSFSCVASEKTELWPLQLTM